MSSTKKYTTVYMCCSCNETFSDEDDAIECCAPKVETLYECSSCKLLHDSSSEAEECCVDGEECCADSELIRCGNCSRDYESDDINAYVLDVVGKCTHCTPLISVEDRCEISSRIHDSVIRGTEHAALEEEIHKL